MKEYFDLKGQVALITGCSTGLGVQMAKALANQGAIIVPVARRQEKVEAVAKEYDGKVTVAKCNVDECEDIAVQFGIRNIPTLLFFKGGQVVDKLVGNVPKGEITAKLDAII